MSTARATRRDPAILEEAAKVIKQVAARFARAWRSLDARDLEAVAWEECLLNFEGYDPARGPAEAYFRILARRAMGRYCGQIVAKVSMGKRAAYQGKDYQASVEVEIWDGGGIHPAYADVVEEQVENSRPDGRLLYEAATTEQEARRERVRELLDQALSEWDRWDRYVVYRLHGLDGWRAEKPRELAARLKVDVRRIYRVHARLEREIWNVPALYLLAKET